MSIALLTIATGKAYRNYANALIESVYDFWPEADTIVFSDDPKDIVVTGTDLCFYTEAKGYPNETLFRYHTFLNAENLLRQYDHVFYCDADMLFVAPVGDVLSNGLVATLHPGYIGKRGTPEKRLESTAYCNWNSAYYCGGFQGGKTEAYIDAMKTMRERINIDEHNGIKAVWHDESHWNRELSINKPSKVLTPSYCYPEDYDGRWGWPPDKFQPILMALDKKKRGNHWCLV